MTITAAKVLGIVLIALGLVGVVAGEAPLFGILNTDFTEDLVHLITGGLLTYAGFAKQGRGARQLVMTLGVIYALFGVVGFISPTVFGLIPSGYGTLDNVIHLLIGAGAITLAAMEKRDEVV
jgi:hypothetical protein